MAGLLVAWRGFFVGEFLLLLSFDLFSSHQQSPSGSPCVRCNAVRLRLRGTTDGATGYLFG